MSKVKFAYEWLGPAGPIPNNESPSILQIVGVSTDARVNPSASVKYFTTTLEAHIGKYNKDLIEVVSVHSLQKDDFFIYPFEINHKIPLMHSFSPGHSPGLFELSNLLSPGNNALHGIRSENGYVLLHFSYEAYLEPTLFRRMHEYFKYHKIPLNKVIYQTGSPDAYRIYQEYCDRENERERMLVGFWDMNEYNLSRIYKDTEEYEGNKDFSNIQKTFLCLNRRFRWHRNALFALFHKYDILKDSYFSMPYDNADHTGQLWKEQCDRGFISSYGLDVEELQQLLPLVVDHRNYDNMVQDTTRHMKKFYETSLISVVTETTCDNYALQISEKTFKPIFYLQPFIVVNSPGSLKYLKSAGYKTFSDFFDESYDEIINNNDRVVRIGELCKEINSWSLETKKKFFDETRPIVNHNLQVLYEVFPKKLKGEFWDFIRSKL
jgi:hypothetical protein